MLRRIPRQLPSALAGTTIDDTLRTAGVGVLNIRSVYDFGNGDAGLFDVVNFADIQAMADPLTTTAAQRPVRFLRVTKAVAIPNNDTRDFINAAFGPTVNQGMREIVGYVPVAPDGSVKVQVPADVPLAVSLVDADGRRVGARHQSWIQVRPGETRSCTGCHTGASERPHGRATAEFPSINTGAQTTGQPFPNTVASLPADFGETMAETRYRHSQIALDNTCLPGDTAAQRIEKDCDATSLSRDLIDSDVWTNATPTAQLTLSYDGLTTTAPGGGNCVPPNWTSFCRVVVNYETHIHPIWSVVRPNPADTCTACHTSIDVANANAPRIPDAQLDLGDDGPNENDDRFKAYRELFFGDVQLTLDADGNLVPLQVPVLDENGDQVLDENGEPVTQTVAATPGPSLSSAGAAQSNFFTIFAAGGSHQGRLTNDELRLIAEWVDVGGQYYNNPFDAPLDD